MIDPSEHYRQLIDSALDQYLQVPADAGARTAVYESMRYSVLGSGKRIRPLLTLSFCALFGKSPANALPFACAVEMVHAYSLIHDDLPSMDNDSLRRGKPTNHRVYGEGIALLAGDGLLTKAFEVAAAATGIDPLCKVKALSILAEKAGAAGMIGGQCIDLTLTGKPGNQKILEQMDLCKTAALISAACQLGCIAAGAGAKLQEAANAYAEGMGLAFQIRDDVLGAIGETAELGKTVGLDAENGKRNYVSLLGAAKAQQLVEAYTEKALRALQCFPGNTDFLKQMTLDLVNRRV